MEHEQIKFSIQVKLIFIGVVIFALVVSLFSTVAITYLINLTVIVMFGHSLTTSTLFLTWSSTVLFIVLRFNQLSKKEEEGN